MSAVEGCGAYSDLATPEHPRHRRPIRAGLTVPSLPFHPAREVSRRLGNTEQRAASVSSYQSRRAGRRTPIDEPNRLGRRSVPAALAEVWSLARPHRRLLWMSLALIAINRAAGLVLPGSTKFLIDGVIGKHLTDLLLPLVGAVVVATAVQGVTSFVLTQSLSKTAQRLIAELRTKVHAHVSRLPIAYYDATAPGPSPAG